MAAAPLAAQSSPELVTHFYVDPHYGSDSNVGNSPGAPWNNPRCTNGCSTATNLCNPVDVALQSGAVLRNNPWPFKTINGPNGALASIPSGGLPYTSPVTGVTTRYVIIHLMPGLYARTNAFGSSPRNPDNGLKPNGEVFPIHLPKGVSIQGTSALNTVFCLGDGQNSGKGPAFEFGTGNATGEGTFIDSIAIYGALKDDGVGKDASAIYLSPNVASSPTITNCFFYGNVCGIGVEGDINAGKVHDGTKIFNNTFAYNKLGIWNGSKAPDSSGFHIGYSKLILVNNIFDLNPPPSTNNLTNYGHYPLGTNTAMEGIHPDDLLVLLGGGAFGNFNAYPRNTTSPFPLRDRFDRNIAFPPFPKTKPRNPLSGGVTPQPSSNLDIRDYTENPNNGTSGQRGILFVADLLYWWGQNNSSVSNFDYSPHDLRLAPGVGPYQANFSLIKTTVVNPLVNGGWAVDPNNFSL
ncbi:MAG TPA: hypothetical protein ENK02_04105, partial [Planctomycetes bacterium]|nr:hypothetical protein [Planctomycetota bacterium]